MAKSIRRLKTPSVLAKKPRLPKKDLFQLADIRFRHELVLAVTPLFMREFFNGGDAWADYEDLADSIVNVIDEIESRFL